MSPKLPYFKARRTRWITTLISVLAILAGWKIATSFYHLAHIADLERYKYGESNAWLDKLQPLQAAPLGPELLFVLGYGLVLLGFAVIYWSWATSSFGRAAANYVLAAAVFTVLADVVKDSFLSWRLHSGPAWYSTVVSAAATVKWCAALLALGGVAAVVGLSGRAFAGFWRIHAWPCICPKARKKADDADVKCAQWWDKVWEPEELPPAARRPTAVKPVASEHNEENETSWRKAYNVPGANAVIVKREDKPVQAICLSGGGVRSACIAMGATQVFSKAQPIHARPGPPDLPGPRHLIDTVDYVISVSGGGFTAGARLLATHPSHTASTPKGSSTASEPRPLLSQRFAAGSPEFDHFRRGSSYIFDTPAELVSALAVVLKNLLASLAILFSVPAILGWVFGYLSAVSYFSFATFVPLKREIAQKITSKEPAAAFPWQVSHGPSWWAVGFFAFLAVLAVLAASIVEWLSANECGEKWRLRLLGAARANAVFAVLVLALVAGLPGLMRLCSTVDLDPADATKILSGVIGLNYVAAIFTMVTRKASVLPLAEALKPSWWKRLLPPAVLQLILAVLTFALVASAWLIVLGSFAVGIFQEVAPDSRGEGLPHMPHGGLILLGAGVVFLSFADVTSLSLHPFYRSRLGRTFAVRRVGSQAKRYDTNEWTWLNTCGIAPYDGPKFIFATAASLSGEATTAPGLDAVSYVLSADCIGGPELGWLNTSRLLAVAPPRIRQDLTVIASVAVSGAAFASAMGRQSKGYQKLLALSGARLGTWLPNPKLVGNLVCAPQGDCVDPKDETRPWPKSLPTIRGAGYFYRELLGINNDDARLVQVTDGGHYENLGLVEALRRRCRLIFCIDAGGDAPPLLSSLSDAMRLAKYELGVKIDLNEQGKYSVDNIAAGSGRQYPEGHALARLNSRVTKGTVAFGRITYPPAAGLTGFQKPRGILIFAKAVLWEDCPEWLLTYAASSTLFPHDPTSDQWFNEAQFAAYTTLGTIMGRHAVECANTLQRSGLI